MKKILSVILSILMIVTMIPLSVLPASAAGTFVEEIAIAADADKATAQGKLTNNGYTLIDVDLNKGCGSSSDYIYIGYKTTTKPNKAIRSILFLTPYEGEIREGWLSNKSAYHYPIGCSEMPNGSGDGFVNLNSNAGGTQLYMYVSREIKAGAPLTEMMINGSSSQSGYSTAVYVFSEAAQNLNEGTSGDALYLHYKDAPEYSGLDYQDFNDLYLELESYLYKDSVAEDVKQAVREALASYDEVIELNFANEMEYVREYTIYIRQSLRDLQSYIVAEESDFAAIDASLVNLDSVLAGVSVSDIITQEAASIKADLAAYRANPATTKADVASLQDRIDMILTVVNNCKNGQHEWSDVDGSCLYGCGAVCSHDVQSGTCGICGAEVHACDFSGKWNSDSANHWKQCACGKTAQLSTHTWSNGVCRTCSYACTHPTYDANKNCTVCGSACVHSFTNGFCSVNGCYEAPVLKDDYYQIDNAGKLFWFANYVNTVDRTANAVLTADIDLEGKLWTPIGSTGENNNNFRGVFDGQNHTIEGLYVEGGRAGLGFFGEVRTGTVKNFTIYGDVVVNTEVDYVGGVIGSVCGLNSTDHGLERNGAIIQNITSYVNLTAKAHGIGMIGGFVGYANHQSLIENCSWYGTFDAGIYRVDSGAGGFVGKIQENTSEVTIRNCGAYGTIKTNYAKNSYKNTATIYIGGFLSFTNTNAKTTLENCLFAGKFERGANLTDEAFLGAFGTVRSVNAIKNCYYLGDDGLEAVHGDSPLKPGSDNVEIKKVTEEQLKSGEIAYKLGDAWGQTVGTDDDPVLGGEEVYYGYISCADDAVAVYSNNSKASATKPAHDWSDKNGICANGCGSKCTHAGQTGEICTICGGNTDGCYFDKNGFCSCGKYQQPTGSGTESDPYKISNAGQLYWFAAVIDGFDSHTDQNLSACAELTNDIIINENVLNEDGSLNEQDHREWIVIGYDSGTPYLGSFDGKNFTISGMYDSTCSENTMSGLFGYLGEGGKISNVTLSDSYINGVYVTGGIVGWNEGTVTDCRNNGLVCAADHVGGVVGFNSNIVSNCHNTGTVKYNNGFAYGDGDTMGGVVGSNDGTLSHCSNTGNVEGNDMYIGGIAGSNDGTLIHCSNTGNVSGDSLVGGVVGHNDGTVTFCSNTATVKGTSSTESYYIGGVAGHNLNTVKSSYNTGEVIGRLWIGGIAGANPKNTVISDCFNTGMVSCTTSNVDISEFVGGISGNNYGTVTACYYLTGTAPGGIARKDIAGQAEVKTAEQFASGDVAYFLQGDRTEQVWGQKIGTDALPVFGGDKVYGGYTTCKDDAGMVFTNKAGEVPAEKPAHDWSNKDGICANCGKECAHEDQTGAICGICGGELHVCSFINNGICSCGVFEPATGSGTESDPYLISNAGQLYWFSAIVSTGYGDVAQNKAACAELTADITVNNNVLNEDGTLNGVGSDYRAWNRIGDDDYKYTGTFDGNHFTVSGLYIKKYENHVGLFGYVGQGGKVSNLTLADSYIFGSSYVGLVGTNYGTVQNCRNNGRMEAYYIVAGVAGENRGTVKNCSNNGWIQSNTGIGGVVCYNFGTIEDCYNAGSVTKTSKGTGMGGVACNNKGTIVNCYNIGTLTIVSGDYLGGVVCNPAENSTLTNCYYLAGTAEGGINGADVVGQAEVKTAEQFASGEVAYLLQGARTEQVWGQTIGTEDSPVLGGDKVYGGYTTCKDGAEMVYTNHASDVSAEKPAHNWSNLDGVCANGCGAVCAHEDQTGETCEICGATIKCATITGVSINIDGVIYTSDNTSAENPAVIHPDSVVTFTVTGENFDLLPSDLENAMIGFTYFSHNLEWLYNNPSKFDIDTVNNTVSFPANYNVLCKATTASELTYTNDYWYTDIGSGVYVIYIDKKDIADTLITLDNTEFIYSGYPIEPTVLVMADSQALMEGEHYTLTFESNVNAGTASVTVKGIGDYTGEVTKYFTITKAYYNLTAPTPNTLTYNGEEQYLVSAGTVEGAYFEYSLDGVNWSTSIPQAKDAGDYTVCYRVLADENHYGIEGTVDVTIKECAHEWDEGVLTRPVYDAVLGSKDGYYTYTCTLCGDEKTETVKIADYSVYEAVSEEINGFLQSDDLTSEAKQAIYSAANECGLLSNDLTESEQNIVDDLVAELQQIVDTAEEKIASGEYVKADYTAIDEAIEAVEEKLASEYITDESKAEFEEIKTQLEEMKADGNTSIADVTEFEKVLEDYEAELDKGIEDGTLVKFSGERVFLAFVEEAEKKIDEKYGENAFYDFANENRDSFYNLYDKYFFRAVALEGGTMAENAANIEYIKGMVDELFGKVENCLDGTHNYGTGVLTRPHFNADSGFFEAGYYTYTCTLCGHSYTEPTERADITALTDASMKITEYIGNDTLTLEARDEIHKRYLDILKNNGNIFDELGFVRNDLIEEDQPLIDAITEELQRIYDDADEKIASGEYVKADYTKISQAINAIEDKIRFEDVTDEGKAGLEEIKKQFEEMMADETTSAADLAELEKALEEYEAELDKGIEDGTLVELNVYKIGTELSDNWKEKLEAEGLIDAYEDFVNNQKYTDEAVAALEAMEEFLTSLEGTVAENAGNIAKIYEMFNSFTASVENCLRGTHNFKDYEITSPAKCGKNAIETRTCRFCAETDEREVEGTALSHSFTKYEVTEAPECEKAGKEVAYCDHGCGATDENEIPALEHTPLAAVKKNEVEADCENEGSYDLVVYCDVCGEEISRVTETVDALGHSFTKYASNNDASCEADGTKTAHCDNGCGKINTVTDKGSKLDHIDANGDDVCDVCHSDLHVSVEDCECTCHHTDIFNRFVYKILQFIRKLFGINSKCDCGTVHTEGLTPFWKIIGA